MTGVAKKSTLRARRAKTKTLQNEARKKYTEDVKILIETRLAEERSLLIQNSPEILKPLPRTISPETIPKIPDILFCPRFYIGRDTCRVTTFINGKETVAKVGGCVEFEHGLAFDGLGRTSLKPLSPFEEDEDDNELIINQILFNIGKKYSEMDYESTNSSINLVKSKNDVALFELQLQKTIRYMSTDKILLLFLIEMKKLAETTINTSITFAQLILSNELQSTLKLPQLQQLLDISNRIGLRIIF